MENETIHLDTHPKLAEHKAIKKLVKALSEPLQQTFCHGSITGAKVLTLYFKHPLHVNEFLMQKEAIKAKMRAIYKEEHLAGSIFFKDIDARVKQSFETQATKEDTRCPYKERAKGFFANNTQGRVGEIFEELRAIVKERCE